jgi:hypothetical protein
LYLPPNRSRDATTPKRLFSFPFWTNKANVSFLFLTKLMKQVFKAWILWLLEFMNVQFEFRKLVTVSFAITELYYYRTEQLTREERALHCLEGPWSHDLLVLHNARTKPHRSGNGEEKFSGRNSQCQCGKYSGAEWGTLRSRIKNPIPNPDNTRKHQQQTQEAEHVPGGNGRWGRPRRRRGRPPRRAAPPDRRPPPPDRVPSCRRTSSLLLLRRLLPARGEIGIWAGKSSSARRRRASGEVWTLKRFAKSRSPRGPCRGCLGVGSREAAGGTGGLMAIGYGRDWRPRRMANPDSDKPVHKIFRLMEVRLNRFPWNIQIRILWKSWWIRATPRD